MNHTEKTSGQALITVLFISVIGILITTGAVSALMSAFTATSEHEVGNLAYGAAESGVENAVLRLMRDPAYTGETLIVSPGRTATVSVNTASGIVITSVGVAGSISRKIVVSGQYNNLIFAINSWNEVP